MNNVMATNHSRKELNLAAGGFRLTAKLGKLVYFCTKIFYNCQLGKFFTINSCC